MENIWSYSFTDFMEFFAIMNLIVNIPIFVKLTDGLEESCYGRLRNNCYSNEFCCKSKFFSGTDNHINLCSDFGVELGGRYSFSDNLDGYTSQYSSSNGVYYF
ncbi:MAG: hypothetical protein IMZ52_10475 [Actinobacteria bacterium]|nr:hypothetical protein [Actinomycetota bacterium]